VFSYCRDQGAGSASATQPGSRRGASVETSCTALTSLQPSPGAGDTNVRLARIHLQGGPPCAFQPLLA
jgi:hypothetical protein